MYDKTFLGFYSVELAKVFGKDKGFVCAVCLPVWCGYAPHAYARLAHMAIVQAADNGETYICRQCGKQVIGNMLKVLA